MVMMWGIIVNRPLFGTLSDFDKLVNQSKKLGIRLIMDMVAKSYFGPTCLVSESCKSYNSKKEISISGVISL